MAKKDHATIYELALLVRLMANGLLVHGSKNEDLELAKRGENYLVQNGFDDRDLAKRRYGMTPAEARAEIEDKQAQPAAVEVEPAKTKER